MAIFAAVGGALGATVRVKCPHCGKVQVRARGQHHYRCHDCHKAFDVGPGGTKKTRLVSAGKRHGH
jgi:transposase-like protein